MLHKMPAGSVDFVRHGPQEKQMTSSFHVTFLQAAFVSNNIEI